MAIFSGKDADLPLLTQFFQLDVPTGWEQAEEILWGSELDTWDEHFDPLAKDQDADTRLKWLKTLAEMQLHATLVMRAVADDTPVPFVTFNYLNVVGRDYLSPRLQGSVHGRGFVGTIALDHSPAISDAYAEMLRELIRVAGKQAPTSRCVCCGAVYLERREIQKYCSWRCSNRERVRRQRQKAAAEEASRPRPVFATAQNATSPTFTPARPRYATPAANDFDDNDGLSDPFAE